MAQGTNGPQDAQQPQPPHPDEAQVVGPDEVPPSTAPVGHSGARVDVTESKAWSIDGFVGILISLALIAGAIYWFVIDVLNDPNNVPSAGVLTASLVLLFIGFIGLSSLTIISPGQTRVLQFFGRYIGTVRRTGLSLVVPLTTKEKVSVRVHNFETNALKVNDAHGNPVEIGAIVVWQVADTARASFSVEDYESFVKVQSESALRHVTGTHPYDDFEGDATSLRGSTDVVSAELAHEVAERVAVAGVEILEVRISHLAYAPEIAQAMLQRQQAGAIVAARSKIVEGAVGMVEMALAKLEEESIVELDDERKAAMVSNLLVVLCGEQRVTPVVNSGSLYT